MSDGFNDPGIHSLTPLFNSCKTPHETNIRGTTTNLRKDHVAPVTWLILGCFVFLEASQTSHQMHLYVDFEVLGPEKIVST